MRRILVIGAGGAGKSTLAARLARCLALPLVHLDALYWRAGWEPTPADEWRATVERLVSGERWIMDGNYSGTLPQRLARADTVVYLDLPRHVSLWRVLLRRIRHRGRSRPDMAVGCPERLTWEFVTWIWSYPRTRRPRILALLGELPRTTRVVVLRTAREVERFAADACAGRGDVA